MDPFIGGALISGATSLLGGLFGRSQAKSDLAMQRQLINEQNEYNNPTNIRKRAEEAGFNPLSFIGPGVGLQTQTAQVNSGNYMGAAIADAGMAFAGAMADKAKFAETKKLNDLEMANAKLQNQILQLTLRPKVGGVYAGRQSTPTIQAALGGGNAVSSDSTVVVGVGHNRRVSSRGVGDSVTPPPMDRYNLYVEVYDPLTGRTSRIPNPDLMDAGPVEMATGMATIGAADAVQNGVPKAKSVFSAPSFMGSPMAGGIPFGQRYRNYSSKTYRFPKLEWPTGAPVFGWAAN